MGLASFSASRRGILGLFAAAVPAAVIAAPVVIEAPAPVGDWRTKPVSNWTKADFIAEAQHKSAELTDRIAVIGKEPQSEARDATLRGLLAGLNWWIGELDSLMT